MAPEQLIIGLVLKSRTENKVTRTIEDFMPAGQHQYRRWKVNGQWLNYAEVEARYTVFRVKGQKA